VCFVRDPATIIVSDARRDSSLVETDSFQIVLDTYRDQQNGFVFGTNPAGLEYDGQLTNEGEGSGGIGGGLVQRSGSFSRRASPRRGSWPRRRSWPRTWPPISSWRSGLPPARFGETGSSRWRSRWFRPSASPTRWPCSGPTGRPPARSLRRRTAGCVVTLQPRETP